MAFKKTFWMNVVGAIGWFGFYAAVIVDLTDIVFKTLLYGYLIAIPTLTAYVIKTSNQQKLYLLAKLLNYSLLIILALEFVTAFYVLNTTPYHIKGALLYYLVFLLLLIVFVIPSIINMRTLKAIGK
jgi:hypothetical protein